MYRMDPLLIVDSPICFRRNQAAHRAAKKPPRPHASVCPGDGQLPGPFPRRPWTVRAGPWGATKLTLKIGG